MTVDSEDLDVNDQSVDEVPAAAGVDDSTSGTAMSAPEDGDQPVEASASSAPDVRATPTPDTAVEGTIEPDTGEDDESTDGESATTDAVILTVLNQKGGVGKTTTTVSLGAALAEDGLRVLVVDLDPQGNATTGLGLRIQEGAPSTYRVIVEGLEAEAATEATSVRGLHVLPSSLDLAGAEIELVPQFSREGRLSKALDEVRGLYDVILVDCPPSLGLLTINGLVAADQVIVPIQCEYYALEGLGQLLRTVELVRTGLNADLELCGVLMTMYDGRTNLSQQVVDEVRNHFGDQAFRTIIPRTVRLSEAPSYGQPITIFDPTSRGARAYQRLASELAQRIGLRTASAGQSALDRLLGTAKPVADDGVPPPPPPVPVDDEFDADEESSASDLPSSLPTDLHSGAPFLPGDETDTPDSTLPPSPPDGISAPTAESHTEPSHDEAHDTSIPKPAAEGVD